MTVSDTLFNYFLSPAPEPHVGPKPKELPFELFVVEKIAVEVLFRTDEHRHVLLLRQLLTNDYLTYLWSHLQTTDAQSKSFGALHRSVLYLFCHALDLHHPGLAPFLAELESEPRALTAFLCQVFESSLVRSHSKPSLALINSLYRRFSFLKRHATTTASFLLKMISIVTLKNGLSFHAEKMAFCLSQANVESKLYTKCVGLAERGDPVWQLASRWLASLMDTLFDDEQQDEAQDKPMQLERSATRPFSRTCLVLSLFCTWLSQRSTSHYPGILFREHHILVQVDAKLEPGQGLQPDVEVALRDIRDRLLLLQAESASPRTALDNMEAFQKACFQLHLAAQTKEPSSSSDVVTLRELALAPPWLLRSKQSKILLFGLSQAALISIFDSLSLLYQSGSSGPPFASEVLVSALYARMVDDGAAFSSPSSRLLPGTLSELFSRSLSVLTLPCDDYLSIQDYCRKSYYAFLFYLADLVKTDILESLSALGPTSTSVELGSSESQHNDRSAWLWSSSEYHHSRQRDEGVHAMPIFDTTPVTQSAGASMLIVNETRKLNLGLTRAHSFNGWRKGDEVFLIRLANPHDASDKDKIQIAHVLPCYYISHLSDSPHSIVQVQEAQHEETDASRDRYGSATKAHGESYHVLMRRKGTAAQLMLKLFDLLRRSQDGRIDASNNSEASGRRDWRHSLLLGRADESEAGPSQTLEHVKPGLAVMMGSEARLCCASSDLLRQFYLIGERSLVLAKTNEALERLELRLAAASPASMAMDAGHRRCFVGRMSTFTDRFTHLTSQLLASVERLASSLGDTIQSDALDCSVSEHYYRSKIEPLLDSFFSRLDQVQASDPDSLSEGELLLSEFPLAAYFGSRCESLLHSDAKSWSERSCFARELRAEVDGVFLDLIALRPLELLTTKPCAHEYLKRHCSIVLMTYEQLILSLAPSDDASDAIHFDNILMLDAESLVEAEALLPILSCMAKTGRLVLATANSDASPPAASRGLLQRVMDRSPSSCMIRLA